MVTDLGHPGRPRGAASAPGWPVPTKLSGMASDDVTLTRHDGAGAFALLDDLDEVYADAYGVEPDGEKSSAFRSRAANQFDRAGFALVTAHSGDRLVGFAFGYTLPTGDKYWWKGLEPGPAEGFATETGSRTFVVSEIEVRGEWQGKRVGRAVHDALLDRRPEERATLATGPDAQAQPVYERWGWRRAGRVPGSDGEYHSAYDLFVISLPLAKS